MASPQGVSSSDPSPGFASSDRLSRVDDAGRAEALSMLLSGRGRADDPAVKPFLAFAQEHALRLDELWTLHDGRRLLASALLVPGVGKTAMLFLSPVPGRTQVRRIGRLVARAAVAADPDEVKLVQALLEADQPLQHAAIEAGGFRHLAELIYMQKPAKPGPDLPPVRLDGRLLEAVHWSSDHRPLFAEAIAVSYIDTLDCPGLLGLRAIDDVIAGHMATGRFDPEHWTVWTDAGRPQAVLLLAEAHNGHGHELVYVGVSPEARGRGLARQLMRHALHLAGRRAPGQLFLAVDQQNEPALRLYRGLGFKPSARKSAWIWTP